MKTRLPLLAALILLSALLCACTPPDKAVILVPTPVQTHDSAFDPTPAPVDVDFSACTQALEAVPFSPYEWELPIEISMYSSWADALPTGPVEMACAMQNMQGVVFVGTEEDGRQFLAAIDLERAKAKRLYTLEAGMRVTSLVQTKKYGRADETGAFTWTETDGDAWHLRLYDERLTGDPAADAALLGETTLEQGALSQGDAFLPAQSSAELADDLLTFALLSQGEPTLRTASHGGVSYPLPGAEPVCYAGAPVCKVGEWNLVYLEERDGVPYFCFAALDEGAQCFAEVFRASYRLPEGEEIAQILEMHMDSPSAWRICLRTSAGKIYWHERRADGTADTRLVAADVVAAEGTLYADAFAICAQQSRLVRFRSDQETLKEFFLDRGDMPAELTAITAAYTGEYAHEPYGIFVFAVAEGKPRLFHMEIDSEGREASN